MSVDSLAARDALRDHPPAYRVIVAASMGNALEWYDFLIYGYFAVTIAKVFFPAGNDAVSLLQALGAFGLSYLVRPLGAIMLGAYADRAGRKAALMLSILLMMIGTTIMAVIPGYATIGVAAPAMVLLARLLQGFSVGGEFGSATAFLVEHSKTRKGFMASWQWASQGLTALVASAFGVLLTSALSADQLLSWGWRIPFFFGLLIGPVGLYIRSRMAETPELQEEAMQAWGAWFATLGESVADMGNPFGSSATVTSGGVADGGAAGAGGYSIVSADSLSAATAMAKGCPVVAGGGAVEVYEAIPM